MTRSESTMDDLVLWGAQAGIGPGYTLEAAAVRLADDIAELRDDGGIPPQVRTLITVLPQQRTLEIRVEGLSIADDPDRTTTRNLLHSLFELASYHNIVSLDDNAPPLFTQRILLIDSHGQPFAALLGTGIGDLEAATLKRSQTVG